VECVKARPEKRPEMQDVTRRLEVSLFALHKTADLPPLWISHGLLDPEAPKGEFA
jgi:hypothetical protein